MKITSFCVAGEPQGKARPRFTRYGRTYTPCKTTAYEYEIREAFRKAGGKLTELPVKVQITAYYKIPISVSRSRAAKMDGGEILPTKKPDTDNIAKAVCDALNGVAYKDDAQVCSLVVEKVYSHNPMIFVTVSEIVR